MRNMMKVIMLVVVIGMLVSTASADVTIVNVETGEIRVGQPKPTNERLITLAEQEVIAAPGREVSTDLCPSHNQPQDFWCNHHQLIKTLKIFLLVAIGLMILSNFSWWKNYKVKDRLVVSDWTLVAAISAIFALFAAFVLSTFACSSAGTLFILHCIALVALFAALLAIILGGIAYWSCSAILYVLAIVALFI